MLVKGGEVSIEDGIVISHASDLFKSFFQDGSC